MEENCFKKCQLTKGYCSSSPVSKTATDLKA
ncbi:hypothetical protein T12_3827 [Trichinella patagoniensis]|uniref:Uncharacterized protein n=1 Tax=Trichinella patagoniensis TaxID=990121 RepID=A0A0V0XJE5_9BILA|nr:hypothetical protein T12_3827 [Trichinella patagoniensis]